MLWAKLTPDDIKVILGSHVAMGDQIRIPIDDWGRMRVDFAAKRHGFGFDELLLANEQIQAGNPPVVDLAKTKGAIVLLARTDTVARSIPFAARRDGSPGELFAAAIATIQTRSFIKSVPLSVELSVLFGLMAFSYRVPSMRKRIAAAVGFLALLVYVMIAMAVFNRWLVWLPGVMPLGVVLFFVIFRVATPDSVARPKKPVIF